VFEQEDEIARKCKLGSPTKAQNWQLTQSYRDAVNILHADKRSQSALEWERDGGRSEGTAETEMAKKLPECD
jgi:hypothetical protein